MSFATLDDLRSQLGATRPEMDPVYVEKMLHDLPEIKVVDRAEFILSQVTGKRVLEFGASGPMHAAIVKAAADVLGVDREASPGVLAFDLDDVTVDYLPARTYAPDVIVCGEVIEHLSNPGWFLTRLKRQYPAVPLLVTVPNAFSSVAAKWLARGKENVNADHVAWYSPHTLSVLLTRAGYTSADLYFYNGAGANAEGLIVVTE